MFYIQKRFIHLINNVIVIHLYIRYLYLQIYYSIDYIEVAKCSYFMISVSAECFGFNYRKLFSRIDYFDELQPAVIINYQISFFNLFVELIFTRRMNCQFGMRVGCSFVIPIAAIVFFFGK